MRIDSRTGRFGLVLLGVVACSSPPAPACSIPVFRYALEYWLPDRYEVVIFHRGPLLPENQAVVDRLKRAAAEEIDTCNIIVHLVDLQAQLDESMQSLWQAQATAQLPWIVLRDPLRSGWGQTIWSRRLDEKAAELLVDSPVRRAITRGLASGQAAVWILLESGDRTKDDAVYEQLRTQLDKLIKALTLAMPPPAWPVEAESADGQTDPRQQLAFSVLRLSRSDPAEPVLVSVLLASEDDLTTFSEPMAFPVFGRGRVLYALVGKGINEVNIAEGCAFVAGPCSCLVKGASPGVDLLMTADWEAVIEGSDEAAPERSLPIGVSTEGGPAEASFPGPQDDWSSTLLRNSLLGVAGGVILVAVAAWILATRNRSGRREMTSDR